MSRVHQTTCPHSCCTGLTDTGRIVPQIAHPARPEPVSAADDTWRRRFRLHNGSTASAQRQSNEKDSSLCSDQLKHALVRPRIRTPAKSGGFQGWPDAWCSTSLHGWERSAARGLSCGSFMVLAKLVASWISRLFVCAKISRGGVSGRPERQLEHSVEWL